MFSQKTIHILQKKVNMFNTDEKDLKHLIPIFKRQISLSSEHNKCLKNCGTEHKCCNKM